MPAAGIAFCLTSAAAFGAMGVVGKLAYGEGATVGTLLATRFTLAAGLFWLVLLVTGRIAGLRALARRDVGLALALGTVVYGLQAGCAFAALDRLDASLFSLLLYTYPVLVTASAVAIGRDTARRSTVTALTLATAGLVLLLASAVGRLDLVGAVLALCAAGIYSGYILGSEGVAARVGALPLSALLCTGAAATLTLAGIVGGDLDPGRVSAEGFVWLGCIALVSTVAAIGLFFAGLRRVGPSSAAILSTLEPVVSVGLAVAVFGDSLGPMQLLGGGLVLAAVLVVRAPSGG